jgi:hypothetical protein
MYLDHKGFSRCTIMSSASRNNFASSIPAWMPFLFCLLVLTRTSSKLSSEMRIDSCLVLILEAFHVSPLWYQLCTSHWCPWPGWKGSLQVLLCFFFLILKEGWIFFFYSLSAAIEVSIWFSPYFISIFICWINFVFLK